MLKRNPQMLYSTVRYKIVMLSSVLIEIKVCIFIYVYQYEDNKPVNKTL